MENKAWNAMEYLDDDLLSAAVADMERPAPGKYAPWIRGMAIAASVAVVVSGSVYLGVRYWDAGGPDEFSVGYSYYTGAFSGGARDIIAVHGETLYPIDDVRITVSYGWQGFDIGAFDHEDFRNKIEYHKITLDVEGFRLSSDTNDLEFLGSYCVKSIDPKEYQSDEYHVNSNMGDIMKLFEENHEIGQQEVVHQFNHSEEIKIPAEMFAGDYGAITLLLHVSYTEHLYDYPTELMSPDEGISFWYKREGDQVRLSIDIAEIVKWQEEVYKEYRKTHGPTVTRRYDEN